ncbi:MAG: hypothetical protein U0929_07150 [Planctomycetaceae bacterium]
MENNWIEALVMPSRTASKEDPGHMVIGFNSPGDGEQHRGFRFSVDDLPKEFQTASRFRDYLFDHCVEGYVVDDINFARQCEKYGGLVVSRRWTIRHPETIKPLYPPQSRREGWYSFNPDNFPDCHNCVTWAVAKINDAVDDSTLTRPTNGRIKHMLAILSDAHS